jgi:hypothetical protein
MSPWVDLLCFLKRIEVHQVFRAKVVPRRIINTVDGGGSFVAAGVITIGACLVSWRCFLPRRCLRYYLFSLTVWGLIGSVGPSTSFAQKYPR